MLMDLTAALLIDMFCYSASQTVVFRRDQWMLRVLENSREWSFESGGVDLLESCGGQASRNRDSAPTSTEADSPETSREYDARSNLRKFQSLLTIDTVLGER